MNLIKKTVILTDADAEGYVSVIRVGNDVGAKIVGGGFKEGMFAGLRIGRGKPVFAVLTGNKTEITLDNVSFQQNDTIGCIVTDGDKLIARGGTGMRLKDVTDYFARKNDVEETLITEPLLAVTATDTSAEATDEGADEEGIVAEGESSEEVTEQGAETSDEDAKTAEEGQEDSEERQSFFERLSSGNSGDFYTGIREKLDELFVIYPSAKELNELIPDSEWIRINYDGDDYYVVGKVKENNRTVLIGYGVPGKKNATPPKIADEIASYLSVDGIAPYDGYWLIFQDAGTGKIIPVR